MLPFALHRKLCSHIIHAATLEERGAWLLGSCPIVSPTLQLLGAFSACQAPRMAQHTVGVEQSAVSSE